jgi:dTDP-4-dehydrorhamnose 3,5-epimerase
MNLHPTPIAGCFELQPRVLADDRGRLVKIFHQDTFADLGLHTHFAEEYYSVSSQRVLRGLHFQTPPHDHIKVVGCVEGKILDVVIDLRKESPTYHQHFMIELSAEKGNLLYVPQGLAHGFYVLSEKAIFINRASTIYAAEHDSGIRWDSAGIDWPDKEPIVSDKDRNMPALADYVSPF